MRICIFVHFNPLKEFFTHIKAYLFICFVFKRVLAKKKTANAFNQRFPFQETIQVKEMSE